MNEEQLKDALLDQANKDSPDYEEIKRLIFKIYNLQNITKLDPNTASSDEVQQVVDWILKLRAGVSDGYSEPSWVDNLLYRKKHILLGFFFPTLSEKINHLFQYNCPICTNENSYPIRDLPIRISAISKQATAKDRGKIRKAFEKAIRSRLMNENIVYKRDDKLCIHVVFVTTKNKRDKDLDNMSKALLDALNKILIADDRNIDHLSLVKLKWLGEEEEEFITVNIRRTMLNEHKDVLLPVMNHQFANGDYLKLEDFFDS